MNTGKTKRVRTQLLSPPDRVCLEQKPTNSSQRSVDTTSRATPMDTEQHAQVQADAVNRLPVIYL